MLKDWRLLPLGTAGRTAVLTLFAHSSLRSGARGATARPADPGAPSAGCARPAERRAPGHGASTSTSRASLRARTGAVLVGLEGREETDATGHAAAILRDLDLAVGDERLSALIDLMLLWLLAAGHSEWRLRGSRRRSAAPGGDAGSIASERIAQLSMRSPRVGGLGQ